MKTRIITLITNKGALAMALNLVEYFKDTNTSGYVVYCLDKFTAEYCAVNSIPYVDYSSKSNCPAEYSDYNTSGFRDVTLNKFYIWLELLDKYDTVFYIDADIVIFENPFIDIESYLIDHDIVMHPDDPDNIYGWMCTGYICMNSTEATKKFLHLCIEEAEDRVKAQGAASWYYNDQITFNDVYARNKDVIKIKLLDDITKYYNGGSIVRGFPFYMDKIIMFHNNNIIGASTKIDRFKQMDAWKLSDTLTYELTK